MSNKKKNKPDGEPDTKPAAEPAVKPLIDPPGRVIRAGQHGMPSPIETKTCSGLLRDVLDLPLDVPVENVCDDAAREILQLRKELEAR